MKTLQIIDGEVFAGDEKPICSGFENHPYMLYLMQVVEWRESLISISNAHVSQHQVEGHDVIVVLKPVYDNAEPGQQIPDDAIGEVDGMYVITKLR